MRFVIVTGVSGAGKTAALKMLEDANYFCVDNLPIPLLEKFASLMPEIHGEDVQNVALGIDARSGRSLDELEVVLEVMKIIENKSDFVNIANITLVINDF